MTKLKLDVEAMNKRLKEIQKNAKVKKIENTEEHKAIVAETNKRIKEAHKKYAEAYENAKNFIVI